jgi:hypothetical protein
LAQTALPQAVRTQSDSMLMNKPGSFKITNGNLSGFGTDSYGKNCSYTAIEEKDATTNLLSLINLFRQTPVLTNPMGFDGIGHFNTSACNSKYGYGIPCTVNLFFEAWLSRKGKVVKHIYEPPQFRIEVNRTDLFCSNGFTVASYSNAYQPTNPLYDEKAMNKATVALRELFFLPAVKEELCAGIDRYGDTIVVFNTTRPAYWQQVTINEVFSLLFDYWITVPDNIASETMMNILHNEYHSFSEKERNGFAYMGNPESISKIGSAVNLTPVMRPNPAYWNRNISAAGIQFMVLGIPAKESIKTKMEDQLKKQDDHYYVSRMLYDLDVIELLKVIAK